jgi:single-stranded DNA-binding protein
MPCTVIVNGFLGSDPQQKTVRTANGNSATVTTLKIASNDWVGTSKKVLWFTADIWGDRFSNVIKFLRKGSAVYLSGTLFQDEFVAATNETVRLLKIAPDKISFPAEKNFSGPPSAEHTPTKRAFVEEPFGSPPSTEIQLATDDSWPTPPPKERNGNNDNDNDDSPLKQNKRMDKGKGKAEDPGPSRADDDDDSPPLKRNKKMNKGKPKAEDPGPSRADDDDISPPLNRNGRKTRSMLKK